MHGKLVLFLWEVREQSRDHSVVPNPGVVRHDETAIEYQNASTQNVSFYNTEAGEIHVLWAVVKEQAVGSIDSIPVAL